MAVLGRYFCRLAPQSYIDKSCLLLFIAVAVFPLAVNGQTNIRDWCSLRGIAQLDVSSDVAQQGYLVK